MWGAAVPSQNHYALIVLIQQGTMRKSFFILSRNTLKKDIHIFDNQSAIWKLY